MHTNKYDKVMQSIDDWKKRLFEQYGQHHIMNITLYGSQNYNLGTKKSDVDVKAIYVPSLKEGLFSEKKISIELHNEKNEHCELKDIREMFKMYKKQNLNFLETLYTKYRWDNDNYNKVSNDINCYKHLLANYNIEAGKRSISGQALNTLRQFKTNPSDLKKLAKILHLYLFLEKRNYIENYEDCYYVTNEDTILGYNAYNLLISLKNNKLPPSLIGRNLETTIDFLEDFFVRTFNTCIVTNKNNYDIDKIFEDAIFEAILICDSLET